MQTLLAPETRTVLENIRWETFVELASWRAVMSYSLKPYNFNLNDLSFILDQIN